MVTRLCAQSLYQKRRTPAGAEETLVPQWAEMGGGCEGRISVIKHALGRSRYKGDAGMKRWVGFIVDNLINIGRMRNQPAK